MEDAETRDMYFFIKINEAMDVQNDRGDMSMRPPLTAVQKQRMASGLPSIVKVPRAMVEMVRGLGGGN